MNAGWPVVAVSSCLALASPAAAQRPSAPPTEPSPSSAPAGDAPPVREVGGRLVVTGETVVVTGDPDRPPRDSSIASKVDTPLLETPRSVSLIDRRTLDDLAAINVSQAHDYTVGIFPLDERGPAASRGFPVDFYDLRRDGLRTYSWSVREPVALDRVQYLRGPASVLYGDGSPGGLVNLVLKKPLPVPRYQVSAAGGGLGFGRVTGDATGPVGTARYRVVGAAEWLDNGFDNRERRLTLMPMASIDLSNRATLSVDTEIYDQRGRNYRHTVPATAAAQRGDFSAMPWDAGAAGPDEGWTGRNVAPGARLDVAFGRGASLHVAARYTWIDGSLDLSALSGPSADGQHVDRFRYREISEWGETQTDTFAAFAGRTGPVAHRLVTGIEAGYSTTDTQVGIGPAPPLDLADPDYGPSPPEPPLGTTAFEVRRLGLYVLDELRPTSRLIVVPALRWSRLRVDDHPIAASAVSGAPLESTSRAHAVSPSLGVVGLLRPGLSLYGTYARGFAPPPTGQYLEDGRALEPADHATLEGGIKADTGRLTLTAAVYRITRTNVPEADPRGFSRQIGEARSRGVELEAIGVLARGLVVRAGYAFTDADVTRDASGVAGRELANAPHHVAHGWLRYQPADGPLRRLMTAAGVVHVSDRFTAANNLVVAPSYTRIDASASYQLAGPRLTLGVTAQNLTNRRYVTSGAGRVLYAGPPLRLAVELGTAF